MNVTRIRPVVLVLAVLAVVAAPRVAEALERERPNIVFIFSDDHAYQALGAYGSRINETPALDRLAQQGMRFDNCFVTNSICGPMRATILTGKYSHENGFMINGNVFDGSQTTFPKLLQQAGYQTAMIGKWHLGSEPTGFDHFEVLYGQGPYYNPPMNRNGERVEHIGYTTHVITDLTLDWLENQREADKPFLLMYQHKSPHRNWQPGPDYLTMYDDRDIPEPPTLFDNYEGRTTAAKVQDMTIAETMTASDLKLNGPPARLTEEQREAWEAAYGPKNEAFREANLEGRDLVRWKYQRYIKDYLRCVAAMDDDIDRVLKKLEEEGLAENTIVIYCSDQGFYLGEHGWFDKRWIYEQSLRTPFIVRWPGVVEPGSFNDDIVSSLDFAQTFLEIAGVEEPEDMQGRSLVPLLNGETPEDWREYLYYHYYEFPGWHYVRRHYGVAGDRFKLVHFYNLDEWEMYDLKFDGNELHSIYDHPNYAKIQRELEGVLEQRRRELGVPEQDPPASMWERNLPPRDRPVPEEYRDLPLPEGYEGNLRR